MLAMAAGMCCGQSPSFEIKLPPTVRSETVFIRYVLAGQSFGGWVQTQSGVSSYLIDTAPGARPATGIKAVLYAPGCAIETLNIPLSSSTHTQYSFPCQRLGNVPIAGGVIRPERLHEHVVRLQARYIARWAHTFLGLKDDTVLTIPVGAADHPGELELWVKDQTSGDWIAQLILAEPDAGKARMGGLKIQREYPRKPAFTLCVVFNPTPLCDRTGFARRDDLGSCDR